jgi:DNA polymerase III subunit epsilon
LAVSTIPDPPPAWAALPANIVFVDVETTGLRADDKIVSFGAIKAATRATFEGRAGALDVCHLIFDPGKASHPRAEAVHGYADWTLRHQDLFAQHAKTVHALIHSADLLVAHNAAFDVAFINREFERSGMAPIAIPSHCTMRAATVLFGAGGSSLTASCRRVGLARSGERHGALEDAYLAMRIYNAAHGAKGFAPYKPIARGPSNWIEPPPLPDGPLPPRKRGKITLPPATTTVPAAR